jgi:2-polyprenyl-3-methyl-5-hydroxy-6-metoxy-1,4-benzoquinol methylase
MRTEFIRKLAFEMFYATGFARFAWHVEKPTSLIDRAISSGWLKPGQRILEVGCGLGSNCEHLASLGFDVTAIDLSATAIRKAAQRLEQKGLRARLYQADFLEGLRELPFDGVLDRATLHAFPNGPKRDLFARNLTAMVKPGGTLLLIERRPADIPKPFDLPPFTVDRADLMRLFGQEFDVTAVGEENIHHILRGDIPIAQWRLVKRETSQAAPHSG